MKAAVSFLRSLPSIAETTPWRTIRRVSSSTSYSPDSFPMPTDSHHPSEERLTLGSIGSYCVRPSAIGKIAIRQRGICMPRSRPCPARRNRQFASNNKSRAGRAGVRRVGRTQQHDRLVRSD